VLGLFNFSYSSKNMMNSTTKTIASGLLWAGAWVATAAHAVNDLPGGPAVRQLNMHPPATKIAAEQHSFCMLIFVAVFGVMFYSIWKHRKSVGHKPASFHESVKVEIAWTVVPLIIVVIMAIPATRAVVAQKDTSNADITIKATGYQWRWGYDYLKGEGDGISFISSLDNEQRVLSNTGAKGVTLDNYLLKVDNPLVVPVNKKIRIITTSSDVIHAFAVPSFGIKQDAIPGFVRDTWFKAEMTGDFYGQCQELCGKEHAYMPIHVKVLSEADYSAWVKTQQTKKSAEAQPAQQVAQANTAK
jgi:cytochrome c oxidase subunit 2